MNFPRYAASKWLCSGGFPVWVNRWQDRPRSAEASMGLRQAGGGSIINMKRGDDMLDMAAFGERLRTLRRLRGLTQWEVAVAVCVSEQAVSKWEHGAVLPDAAHLMLLAKERCEMWELFAYMREFVMPAHGLFMANNGVQELAICDAPESGLGWAYIPVQVNR